ncbi:MAG: mechanosensitive ion channel family protein [Desulfobacterales bacterium]|nr:mechanosensitive ion channel family protein [Desulfobacterales bacterium]
MNQLHAYYDALIKTLVGDEVYLVLLVKFVTALIGAWIVWMILKALFSYAEKRMERYELFRENHRIFLLVRRMLFYSLVLGVGGYVMKLLDMALLENLFYGFFIVFMAFPVNDFVLIVLKYLEKNVASKTRTRMDDIIFSLLSKFTGVFIFSIALIMALDMIGVNVMPFITGAGVAGLAIGFAAKDTLSNFIAGILLIIDRPFEVGDRIEIWNSPSNSARWGDVLDIGLRATRIRTTDNIIVIIPNNEIMTRDIINYTAISSDIRVRINFGIAYEADLDAAVKIAIQRASTAKWVAEQPAPVVVVRELADFSVNLELRVWVEDARDRMATISHITEAVLKAYNEADIEIPYPKSNLFISRQFENPLTPFTGENPGEAGADSRHGTGPASENS